LLVSNGRPCITAGAVARWPNGLIVS